MTNQANFLNVLKPETFVNGNEEEQTSFTKVGVAFPHKEGGGFNLKIMDGISVSGDLVILPPKAKSPEASQG